LFFFAYYCALLLVSQVFQIVSIDIIRDLFAQFGTVMDVVVKEYQANRKSQKQSGHGFIHYPYTEEGIQSVIKATSTVKHVIINSIFFDSGLTPTAESILASRNRSSPVDNYRHSPNDNNRHSPSLQQQMMSQRHQMQQQHSPSQPQHQVPLYERGRNVTLTGSQVRTTFTLGEKRTIETPRSSWSETDFYDNLKSFDGSLVSPSSTQSFFSSNEERPSFVPSNNTSHHDSPFSFNRLPSPPLVTSAPTIFTSLAASSNTSVPSASSSALTSNSSLFLSFHHQSSSLSSLPLYPTRV
jgi:hypothetical protein